MTARDRTEALDGLFMGAATAAYQVEGGNTNCDSWLLKDVEGTDL